VAYVVHLGLNESACLSYREQEYFNKDGESDNGYHVGYSFVVVENRSVNYVPLWAKNLW